MSATASMLSHFLAAAPAAVLVEIADAQGSTPRERGAYMLVSPTALFGTIGGGRLEFQAIEAARKLIFADAVASAEPLTLDIPLGPEIGQCCGGRVQLLLRRVDGGVADALIGDAEEEARRRPHVLVFGGGHVGQALAAALTLLPVHTVVVETRAEALDGMPDGAELVLTAVPEEAVRSAPAGAAFVVLTHDHALDFLIVAEALARGDAGYVGMIGSRTKKATFRSWYMKTAGGNAAAFQRLVSPIGGDQVKDKRPAIIAALAAAEIITALAAAAPS